MNIGDKVICKSEEHLIQTMIELAKSGIETDFLYGQLILIVTKVRNLCITDSQ